MINVKLYCCNCGYLNHIEIPSEFGHRYCCLKYKVFMESPHRNEKCVFEKGYISKDNLYCDNCEYRKKISDGKIICKIFWQETGGSRVDICKSINFKELTIEQIFNIMKHSEILL